MCSISDATPVDLLNGKHLTNLTNTKKGKLSASSLKNILVPRFGSLCPVWLGREAYETLYSQKTKSGKVRRDPDNYDHEWYNRPAPAGSCWPLFVPRTQLKLALPALPVPLVWTKKQETEGDGDGSQDQRVPEELLERAGLILEIVKGWGAEAKEKGLFGTGVPDVGQYQLRCDDRIVPEQFSIRDFFDSIGGCTCESADLSLLSGLIMAIRPYGGVPNRRVFITGEWNTDRGVISITEEEKKAEAVREIASRFPKLSASSDWEKDENRVKFFLPGTNWNRLRVQEEVQAESSSKDVELMPVNEGLSDIDQSLKGFFAALNCAPTRQEVEQAAKDAVERDSLQDQDLCWGESNLPEDQQTIRRCQGYFVERPNRRDSSEFYIDRMLVAIAARCRLTLPEGVREELRIGDLPDNDSDRRLLFITMVSRSYELALLGPAVFRPTHCLLLVVKDSQVSHDKKIEEYSKHVEKLLNEKPPRNGVPEDSDDRFNSHSPGNNVCRAEVGHLDRLCFESDQLDAWCTDGDKSAEVRKFLMQFSDSPEQIVIDTSTGGFRLNQALIEAAPEGAWVVNLHAQTDPKTNRAVIGTERPVFWKVVQHDTGVNALEHVHN